MGYNDTKLYSKQNGGGESERRAIKKTKLMIVFYNGNGSRSLGQ